jgi:membrane protein DedA with SNARE-associated domain
LFDTAFMHSLIQQGYAIIFIVVLGEQLGLPIPGGLLLLVAGAIAESGQLDFSLIFFFSTLACLIGDLIWFQIGRRMGSSVLPFICRISFNPDFCVSRTKSIFFRHGNKSLLVAKFIPGVNTIAPPMSGVLRMGLIRFLLLDSLGSIAWVLAFTSLGYWFSSRLEQTAAYLNFAGKLFWLLILTVFILYVLWKFLQWKKSIRQMRLARITPEELKQKIDNAENLFILDVRNAFQFEAEPQVIPGALHQPLENLHKHPPDIPKGREVVLYCD